MNWIWLKEDKRMLGNVTWLAIVAMVVSGCVAVGITLHAVRREKRQHNDSVENRDKAVSTPVITDTLFPQDILDIQREILVDPDIPVLRAYSRQHDDCLEIPFVLTLKKEGARFNCIAQLREDKLPLVRFEGSKEIVSWDNRRQKAAEIISGNSV